MLKQVKLIFSGFFMLSLAVSCNTKEQSNDLNKEVIENLSKNVVISTYFDLYQDAQALNTAVQNIKLGDERTFTQAKEAWAKARNSWEQSEGFLFGPVDFEEIDPRLDSWPVDVTVIHEMLDGNFEIGHDLILKNPEARGFHLIEFLLWGSNQQKTVAALTTRELEFLKIASEDFMNNTQQLYDSWTRVESPFLDVLIQTGPENEVYSSEQEVILEFIEGIVALADEVANEKIAGPLNEEEGIANPTIQESYFSDLSKSDLVNNIQSISNVYFGDYKTHNGPGIHDIVQAKNPELDEAIQQAIQAANQALLALPDSFTKAIHDHRSDVKGAQTKVQELHDLLHQLIGVKF